MSYKRQNVPKTLVAGGREEQGDAKGGLVTLPCKPAVLSLAISDRLRPPLPFQMLQQPLSHLRVRWLARAQYRPPWLPGTLKMAISRLEQAGSCKVATRSGASAASLFSWIA